MGSFHSCGDQGTTLVDVREEDESVGGKSLAVATPAGHSLKILYLNGETSTSDCSLT